MRPRLLTGILALAVIAGAPGCGDTPPAESSTGGAQAPAAALPASLFTSAAPDGAVALASAKDGAAVGDHVVFEGRVGGRRENFLPNRAVFFVTDSSIASCDDLHPGTCKTPWDYCCEPPDNLLHHLATVQVVGADGRPLETSMETELEPLKTIVVSGTVASIDDAGNFVVNADTITRKQG